MKKQRTDTPAQAGTGASASRTEAYACGLRPGDRVRLLRDLVIRDHRNRPTGDMHPKGEIWTVLPDSCSTRRDLWFRQADGELHTWDDDQSVSDWFERVPEADPSP